MPEGVREERKGEIGVAGGNEYEGLGSSKHSKFEFGLETSRCVFFVSIYLLHLILLKYSRST
jgi:hypothetical protein